MTYIANVDHATRHGQGREFSPSYLRVIAQCEDTDDLYKSVDKFELIRLLKQGGRLLGFSGSMIALLEYYILRTKPWHTTKPIVFQSLARTALDLGISERQVQRLEAACASPSARAIRFVDSGNCKRYAVRDESGLIIAAFGADLSPLAALHGVLTDRLKKKKLHDQEWLACKRAISARRRRVRSLLTDWRKCDGHDVIAIEHLETEYQRIAVQLRTHISLADMQALFQRHVELLDRVMAAIGVEDHRQPTDQIPTESQPRSDQDVAQIEQTNLFLDSESSPKDKCFQESVAGPARAHDPILSAGLHHITLEMALAAASSRFSELLPPEPTWDDVVEAAYRLRHRWGISQQSWGVAVELLGKTGGAVCMLLTDRRTELSENPVRHPPAYFRGLVAKAAEGTLHLSNSIFGLIEAAKPCD